MVSLRSKKFGPRGKPSLIELKQIVKLFHKQRGEGCPKKPIFDPPKINRGTEGGVGGHQSSCLESLRGESGLINNLSPPSGSVLATSNGIGGHHFMKQFHKNLSFYVWWLPKLEHYLVKIVKFGRNCEIWKVAAPAAWVSIRQL